jgi:hypothetical protein
MHNPRRHFGCALLLATASLATSLPALAVYSCEGRVLGVGVAPTTGTVVLSTDSGFGSVYICQIDATSSSANGPVSSTQCRAMLSLLMAAQSTGQRVQFYFNDALTCTTHPAWSFLTGWYYGPVVLSD